MLVSREYHNVVHWSVIITVESTITGITIYCFNQRMTLLDYDEIWWHYLLYLQIRRFGLNSFKVSISFLQNSIVSADQLCLEKSFWFAYCYFEHLSLANSKMHELITVIEILSLIVSCASLFWAILNNFILIFFEPSLD